ncbi:MAG: hypothetical protein MJ110_02420 [Lachnospiraceae bacterium]|nr:hypothetical protein [Lachnospiraceae bacterium]
MRRTKKIDLLAEQIMFYSDGKVMQAIAVSEAEDYLRRKGPIGSFFVHESTLSSVGKKLAMRCMGNPIC